MGIEPTRSLFPDPSPVLKTGPGTSRGRAPRSLVTIIVFFPGCSREFTQSDWSWLIIKGRRPYKMLISASRLEAAPAPRVTNVLVEIGEHHSSPGSLPLAVDCSIAHNRP